MINSVREANELQKVKDIINDETFLRLSVLDIQDYDGTLVVMTDHNVPQKFTRMIMRKIWDGPIEIHCATSLMTGADFSVS